MKYFELYPEVKPMEYAKNGLLVSKDTKPCLMCGEPSRFIEVCSEAYFCSEECEQDFFEYMNRLIAEQELQEADEI